SWKRRGCPSSSPTIPLPASSVAPAAPSRKWTSWAPSSRTTRRPVIREPPAFFHRGPSPLARLTFFTLAAVALMIADHRFHALEAVRLSLSVLAHPIQQVASVPSDSLGRIAEYFTSQERLLRENRELKVRVLEQSAAAQ